MMAPSARAFIGAYTCACVREHAYLCVGALVPVPLLSRNANFPTYDPYSTCLTVFEKSLIACTEGDSGKAGGEDKYI